MNAHYAPVNGLEMLILVGDTDFIRLEHAIEMFELIPNAQLAVLPGTTHMQCDE